MFCPNCGMQNEDGALFCAGCGARLAAPETTPVSAPETQILSENPYVNSNAFVPETANTADTSAAFAPPFPVNEMPPVKKKMNKGAKLALILIPIVIVLAALIGIGSFALSKLNSPMVKIGKGFSKLVTSGNAYNYDISVNTEDVDVNISADVKFDLIGKNIDIANGKGSAEGESIKFEGFLHTNDKEFGILAQFEDEKMAVYNGYEMVYSDGELVDAYYIFEELTEALEIEDSEADEIIFNFISIAFDVVNGNKTADEAEDEIIKIIEKYFDGNINFDKSNFEINEEIANQVEKELIKCLTDKKWLEENLGLTVSKDGKTTVYTFNLPIEKAVNSLFDIMEPLIKDIYRQFKNSMDNAAGSEYDYMEFPEFKEFKEDLLYGIEGADDYVSAVIDIEMTKGEISAIGVKIKEKYGNSTDTTTVRIEISKTKEFTAPTADSYKDDVDEAKKIIEEQNNSYGSGDYNYDDFYGDDGYLDDIYDDSLYSDDDYYDDLYIS